MAAECIRSNFILGDRLQSSSSSSGESSWGRTTMSSRKNQRRGLVVAAAAVSNCHLLLGLDHSASKQDIKRAYRNLALQYHPDVCKGTASEHLFTQINLAYESLMSNYCQSQKIAQNFSESGGAQDEWLSEGYTFEEIFGENPRYGTVEESVFFQEANSPRLKSSGRKSRNRGREDW